MKATLVLEGEMDELQEVMKVITTTQRSDLWASPEVRELYRQALEKEREFLILLAKRGTLFRDDAIQEFGIKNGYPLAAVTAVLTKRAKKMGKTGPPYTKGYGRPNGGENQRYWTIEKDIANEILNEAGLQSGGY